MPENIINSSFSGKFFMKPSFLQNQQLHLFQSRLSNQLSPNHPLIQLSKFIDWPSLEKEFENLFIEKIGQPAKPVRLVVGIMMLQHMYGISDENIVYRWIENAYWQYFCGYEHLQHNRPIHPTSLVRWRKRLGEEGMTKILSNTIVAAVSIGVVKKKVLKKPLWIPQ